MEKIPEWILFLCTFFLNYCISGISRVYNLFCGTPPTMFYVNIDVCTLVYALLLLLETIVLKLVPTLDTIVKTSKANKIK